MEIQAGEGATAKAADVARTPLGVIKATIAEYTADRAPRLAAALAFHTIFAMAPLLIIAVSVAGIVLGRTSVQEQLVAQVLQYTGSSQIADFVQDLLESNAHRNTGVIISVIGLIILLVGASNLFNELKSSLNDIWDVKPPAQQGLGRLLIGRVFAIAMVIVTGVALLATILLTTAVNRASQFLDASWGAANLVNQGTAFLLSFALTVLVFAAIYRFVPDLRIAWRDVWLGAGVTALLFSIGRLLISLYLSFGMVGSAYGAAGTLVVVLFWLYYSAQIFFLGAEFTQVFARTRGSRWHEQQKLDAPLKEPESVA